MMGVGMFIFEIIAPMLEFISPVIPGDFFPYFFNGKLEMLQRALVAIIMVTIVAGFLGVFLLIQNLALIGDKLIVSYDNGNLVWLERWLIDPQ